MKRKPTTGGISKDLIEQMTGDTQTPTKHGTDDTQTTHERSTNTLKRYDVRFDPEDWERLGTVARDRGTSISALLRMIVRKWMDGGGGL